MSWNGYCGIRQLVLNGLLLIWMADLLVHYHQPAGVSTMASGSLAIVGAGAMPALVIWRRGRRWCRRDRLPSSASHPSACRRDAVVILEIVALAGVLIVMLLRY